MHSSHVVTANQKSQVFIFLPPSLSAKDWSPKRRSMQSTHFNTHEATGRIRTWYCRTYSIPPQEPGNAINKYFDTINSYTIIDIQQ